MGGDRNQGNRCRADGDHLKPYYRSRTVTLYHGKAEDVLPQLAGTFDACLCDPPYGLSSKEKRNMRRMSPRATSRATASGFMGMAWDARVPGPQVWESIYDALNPGAPLLAFGGTRTFHRLACAIEDGGFILSDTLCWIHGQGFPKGKSQLKPAWEPITLAWKKGPRALAIDASRIAAPQFDDYQGNCAGDRGHASNRKRQSGFNITAGHASAIGRWPANVILDETAAGLLDAQSGTLTSGANPTRRYSPKTRNAYGTFEGQPECVAHRGLDSGGASRFFYCAKASRKERGPGNTHPTVKPLKLAEYLARLILPPSPDAVLLIPFAGSGSEILGARAAGWRHIVAIELNPEYCDITIERLTPAKKSSAAA